MRAESGKSAAESRSLFELLESRLLFARVEGIDVSAWQYDINWNTVYANNKQFAFVRSSRTNLDLDPYFVKNMTNAKAAGVLVGPYHRALPMGEGEAGPYTDPVTDARRFFNAARDYMKPGNIRPVLDIEDGHSLGKTELSKWVNAFTAELKRLSGVQPIIYANTNYATNYLDTTVAAQHDLWIARWNGGNANNVNPQTDQPETPGGYPNPYGSWNVPVGSTTASHSSWDFWQYTSNGDGFKHGVGSARLDLDVFNGEMEQLKRGFLIGYQWNYPNGNPFLVGSTPITIQAEHYDHGGQGTAYNDYSDGEGRLRPAEGVDLKLIGSSTTNYRLYNTFAGEWVEYTIEVAAAGSYDLDLRVSSKGHNGKFHVELRHPTSDALVSNLTGQLTMPYTGAHDTFTNVVHRVSLPAGKHVLRVAFDTNSSWGSIGSIDWLRLSRVTTSPSVTTLTSNTATNVRSGSFANTNYGSSSELWVQQGGADTTREAYIKFSLGQINSINSAKLRIYGRVNGASSLQTNIFSTANSSWSEHSLTWNNRPPSGSTMHGSLTVSGSSNGWYEVDLTGFVKSELAAGRTTLTLVLKNATTSSGQSIFASDETSNAPRLLIT